MSDVEIFLQGEGIPDIVLLRVPDNSTVQALIEVAQQHGVRVDGSKDALLVFKEDEDEPVKADATLEAAGIGRRCRIQVHRCRRIEVSVNFNGKQAERKFAPSATIQRVTKWAVREFGLKDVDAAEHVLQLCGSTKRPDADTHLGALVAHTNCGICFDLVPKQRVEG